MSTKLKMGIKSDGLGKARPHASAGDNWLSRFVNVLINTPPLYAAMKVLAKAAIRSSAQKKGVHWDDQLGAVLEATTIGVQRIRSSQATATRLLNAAFWCPLHLQRKAHVLRGLCTGRHQGRAGEPSHQVPQLLSHALPCM
jgi:hypothetical protein